MFPHPTDAHTAQSTDTHIIPVVKRHRSGHPARANPIVLPNKRFPSRATHSAWPFPPALTFIIFVVMLFGVDYYARFVLLSWGGRLPTPVSRDFQ